MNKPSTIHGKPKHKPIYEEAKQTLHKPEKKRKERKKHDRMTNRGNYLGEKGKISPRGNKQCWKCLRTVGEEGGFKSMASLQSHRNKQPKSCERAYQKRLKSGATVIGDMSLSSNMVKNPFFGKEKEVKKSKKPKKIPLLESKMVKNPFFGKSKEKKKSKKFRKSLFVLDLQDS